jgi:D-alanyl-D-alanine carboxypeptidase
MPRFFEDALDSYIEQERATLRIPGLSIAVVSGGKVRKAAGYGQLNLENGAPAKPESVYQLASVTKQTIAAAILLLEQEGQLTLADPIAKHLPATPASWEKITLRHLLTHTSGLVTDEPLDLTKTYTEGDAIAAVKPLSLRSAPGERWSYCNFGFILLGEVIRLHARQRWDEFLAARFFQPLGMRSTRRHNLRTLVPGRAAGYALEGESFVNSASWTRDFASGGLLTTVLDLAKWDDMLRNGTILKPETRARLFEPVPLNGGKSYPYGLGWNLAGEPGKRLAEHGGSRPGFSTHFLRELDADRSVIVLANRSGADVARIAHGALLRG